MDYNIIVHYMTQQYQSELLFANLSCMYVTVQLMSDDSKYSITVTALLHMHYT